VIQCVAVCCSVLRFDAVRRSVLQCACQLSLESESRTEETRFVGVATWYSVLQCVVVAAVC